MLQLTPEATSHILRVRQERGLGERDVARFVARGPRVGLTFVKTPQPGDRLIDEADLGVYLAQDVADALEESVIDARPEDGKTVLILRRAAAARKTRRRPR